MDVDRRAAGDGGQPRSQVPTGVDRRGGSPRLEEGLLGRFLGQLRRAQQVSGDRVDESAVLPVHQAHRIGVAGAKASDVLLAQHQDEGSSAVGAGRGCPRPRGLRIRLTSCQGVRAPGRDGSRRNPRTVWPAPPYCSVPGDRADHHPGPPPDLVQFRKGFAMKLRTILAAPIAIVAAGLLLSACGQGSQVAGTATISAAAAVDSTAAKPVASLVETGALGQVLVGANGHTLYLSLI